MQPGERYDSLMKIFKPVGITIIVIACISLVLFFVFSVPPDIYVILKIYDHIVSKFVNVSGLNQWLVKGVVIIALIPLLWVLPRVYFGKRKSKKIARAIGLIYIGVFFLTLYFVSKDLYFAHSGKDTLKWYALTPEGVRYYDSPGVDTIYGMPLKPVTPEVIRNLKLWENKNINLVDPQKATLFNPITGEHQVWYYLYPDGTFEFYDKPGYHPITGDPLKAITKEVYFEWKDKIKAKEDSVKIREEEAKKMKEQQAMAKRPEIDEKEKRLKTDEEAKKRKEQQAMVKQPEMSERERRLIEFKSLISQSVMTSPDKPNVAIVIESLRSESGLSPEDTLVNLLKREGINIIEHYFKEGFKTKGYFKEIYGGSTEILKHSEALSKIDCIIIGRINYTSRKGSQIDRDLVSCNINFNYKVINKKGDIVKSDSLVVVSPGFSEDAALERGLEMLAERYSDRIMRPVL